MYRGLNPAYQKKTPNKFKIENLLGASEGEFILL